MKMFLVKGSASLRKRAIPMNWILSRGRVTSEESEIIAFEKNGQYPSDHFPVIAWLRVH